MGCGMVRKVDELGRVVIPKEMRRVLNIKTGSSIEMFINNENQVVLKKFSEISNIATYADALSDIIFNSFSLPCLVCDEESVLFVKGTNKKDFINKNLQLNKLNNLQKDFQFFDFENAPINLCTYAQCCLFKIKNEGYDCGYVIVLLKENNLSNDVVNKILLLNNFISLLLNF